jgi:hypothetical protein
VLAARLQTIPWKEKPAKPSADCSIVALGVVSVPLLIGHPVVASTAAGGGPPLLARCRA